MVDLKTGDILLFNYEGGGWFSIFTSLIKLATKSNYSHVGIVLKDPTFIHPHLKGTYVWESSKEPNCDPQDDKKKLGVQITPLTEILKEYENNGQIFMRRPKCNINCFSNENLSRIHKVVYDKPYDLLPTDWIEGYFQKDLHPQKVDRFWCSALAGYIYTKCGILNPITDWSLLRPCDFSADKENLSFYKNCCFEGPEVRIL